LIIVLLSPPALPAFPALPRLPPGPDHTPIQLLFPLQCRRQANLRSACNLWPASRVFVIGGSGAPWRAAETLFLNRRGRVLLYSATSRPA